MIEKGKTMDIKKTDPEFAERFAHFAFDEVVNEEGQQLEASTRYLAILASVVSQCLPYIGYPRSLNAIACIQKAVEA